MGLHSPPTSRWKRILYENSLVLVISVLALGTLAGQSITGWHVYNEELADHGQASVAFGTYLYSGHFIEATFENWESEFLQMGMFVLLAVWLRQKGSAESRKLYGEEDVDRDGDPSKPDAPWPVHRGGWILRLYRNSLAIAFFVLFAASLFLHAYGGAKAESAEKKIPVGMLEFMGTSDFWFQSLQNWQSEFVSIVAIVGFTIFLRQKGSPQSKPVDESNDATGE